MTLGIHILAEFYGVDAKHLAKVAPVREILESTVQETGIHKLNSHYHQFSPYGVTGFVLLAESHISIHTWPEKNYLALDVYTCGQEGSAEEVYQCLRKKFRPASISKFVKVRGNEQGQKADIVLAEKRQ